MKNQFWRHAPEHDIVKWHSIWRAETDGYNVRMKKFPVPTIRGVTAFLLAFGIGYSTVVGLLLIAREVGRGAGA